MTNRSFQTTLLVTAFTVLITPSLVLVEPLTSLAQTANTIRTQRVEIARGSNSAVIEGSIRGYETVDYIVRANAGQSMNVSMATDNGANYFNILEPGETEVAIFNGSISDNQYEGVLSKTGDYRIRVYLMRSAARRNEAANYRLETIISQAEDDAAGSAGGDGLVPGTFYHATGNIPCAMAASQPTGSCPFGVTREGNGTGSVTVTKPDGSTRTIFFENGNAVSADVSQADAAQLNVERRGDLSIIQIGEERYEIPDAVIFGG